MGNDLDGIEVCISTACVQYFNAKAKKKGLKRVSEELFSGWVKRFY